MALETMKGVESIGGFNVVDLDAAKCDPRFFDTVGNFNWSAFDKFRKDYPVSICHSENMISFKIQEGPIKEVGVNGCQVDTIIATVLRIITKLNEQHPCDENQSAMMHLAQALSDLEDRRKNRELRGVEGTRQR